MAYFYYRNEKLFTVYSLQWTFENPTVNIKTLCNSCVKIAFVFSWVDLRLFLCGLQCPKCEWTIRLVYPLFFGELRLSSNPTKKKCRKFNHSELDTHLCDLYFAMTATTTFQIINLSSWITLYIHMLSSTLRKYGYFTSDELYLVPTCVCSRKLHLRTCTYCRPL
jgi:hypothetical protein